jgi:cell division protein FtsL
VLRLNIILIVATVVCALGAVASQHEARKLFHELEREQERMRQLEVEWGQLQLEQSTWAAHGRIERIARERLRMQAPVPGQMIAVEPPGGGN